MTATLSRLSSAEVKRFVPRAYAAINNLDESAETNGLEPELLELIRLRVSQINGCAYCVQYHTANARELGLAEEKLTLAVVWAEAGIFSPREAAALAWAECVTLVAETRIPEATYSAARTQFSDAELAALTIAVATINVWNRVSIAFRYPPEI